MAFVTDVNSIRVISIIPALQQEINRVPRAGPECILYGVWNTILTWQFPVQEGYVTRPQDRHTSQTGQRGVLGSAHIPVSAGTTKRQQVFDCAMQENGAGNKKHDLE
ncbi:hypothetical protein N7481_008062 [Penicillium waksmanii]|uniref:uncharacterized protein n=1 Tax=Penicillium waksmanii TaxID=69791 RepID=UPI0025496642|nr:uncharacterized protein N7481_008062 [Penicillium waksmanii]KAJ5980764.1 hypothetical protein N7481_008062 [Penicillium waksmanii]